MANVRSVNYGTHMASFVGLWNWDTISKVCQNPKSLLVFKEIIMKWIPENSPCRIWKNYVKALGFCNLVDGFKLFSLSFSLFVLFTFVKGPYNIESS